MAFEIIDPEQFLPDGVFFQDRFLENIEQHDWSHYSNRQVLVRGCKSAIIPPWAYMVITARLVGHARSVRFGNEHDNVVVCRSAGESKTGT